MEIPIQIQQSIDHFYQVLDQYPYIKNACRPIDIPSAPIMGRDLTELREGIKNPEKPNIILLGEPGSGKTAFIQGFTYAKEAVDYLVVSVNIERLIESSTGDKDAELTNGLQRLIEDVERYCRIEEVIMVLFIDEFHRITMLSPSAVEALKPILEKSASHGFRMVAATTFEEYDQWIAPNRPLAQRLLRLTIGELPRESVIDILKTRAKNRGVYDLATPTIFEEIYDISKELLPSDSQPRASIDILNALIGTVIKREYMKDGQIVKEYATPQELNIPGTHILCRHTLNRVIRRSYGIDIDNNVRVKDIKHALETRIFNQDFAVKKVISRLEMIVAGFTDPARPKGSLLLTGPTGVGKTELVKVISETMRIPLKRFDMSRYSRPEDAVAFADSLAQAAWSAPNGAILIDEVEKSSRQAINNLLQVLDDARLTSASNPNRVISFAGNIIFITTNLASEVYQHNKNFSTGGAVDTELIYKALAEDERFETAVLGRLDDIVPFQGLPDGAMAKIAHRQLWTNLSVVETKNRPFLVSPDIIPYIVRDRTSQDTERGGARDAKRNVDNIVLQAVAHYLADEPEERPVIIHLVGKARFKYEGIVDPLSAHVAVTQCHAKQTVDYWIRQLQEKLKVRIQDEGLFVPDTWESSDFVRAIVNGINQGVRAFQTYVDDDRIWIDRALE